jgi:hypothetical protein
VVPSSDGEVEFAKEEQDPDAKGGERPQPLTFAMIRATSEFIPAEATLVIRCFR